MVEVDMNEFTLSSCVHNFHGYNKFWMCPSFYGCYFAFYRSCFWLDY